jgi:asparagine synthase (glutamine-hydrolysing)
MSGIAGWIDHDRDLTRWRPVLRAMTAALSARGPDSEWTWAEGPAGLGYRGRAAGADTDPTAPAVAAVNGRPLAVALVDGHCTGPDAPTSHNGVLFSGGAAAQRVLAGYLHHGDGVFGRIDGDFAIALWDLRTRELLLARDRLGVKPLHYHRTPTGILFGSEPKAVLAHPAFDAVLDAEGLCELLGYAGTPEHGVLRGLRKVRAGGFVRLGRQHLTPGTYWRLEAGEHRDDRETTIARVRELFHDAVLRTLDLPGAAGLLLSGGLDSSATAGVARLLRPDMPLRTYSVTFAGYAEQFRPDPFRRTRDEPYLRDVVELVGAEHTVEQFHRQEKSQRRASSDDDAEHGLIVGRADVRTERERDPEPERGPGDMTA